MTVIISIVSKLQGGANSRWQARIHPAAARHGERDAKYGRWNGLDFKDEARRRNRGFEGPVRLERRLSVWRVAAVTREAVQLLLYATLRRP